jgi:HAD superfamily hydrolase (TIGR01509 family)
MTVHSSFKTKTSPRGDEPQTKTPAILFDLDGTLMDSNYEHVAAWRLALRRADIEAPNAFLHGCIGMRGDLLIKAVFREVGRTTDNKTVSMLEKLHKTYFEKTLTSVKPLPGATALLKTLTRHSVPWSIATGGDKTTVRKMSRPLGIPKTAPVVTADDVDHAKPEPDVFLVAAQRLGVALSDCIVVGDSVWDLLAARGAKALGVGLLCGGSAVAELAQAGAYRVYKHPADLLDHLAEIGIDAR